MLIGSEFKSAQYCSHFISDFVLKNFVLLSSFGLVYLLVPSIFLTWSVTHSSTWSVSQCFHFALEFTKSCQPSLLTWPFIWQFSTTWWDLFHISLILFFKIFLLLAFHMLSSVHNLTNQLPLKWGNSIYKGNQFGWPTQEKFSRTCWIFL